MVRGGNCVFSCVTSAVSRGNIAVYGNIITTDDNELICMDIGQS